jgi:asparagine synthase (glutamine-hydrolysing)
MLKDELWIVVDRITGHGDHRARLHWLGGAFPHSYEGATLKLDTPAGPFNVSVYDDAGRPLGGDVVCGDEGGPRGWLSRYYGEKMPVPSLAVEQAGSMPLTFVSVLGPHGLEVTVHDGLWGIRCASRRLSLRVRDGLIVNAHLTRGDAA